MIYRYHFRGQLKANYTGDNSIVRDASKECERLIKRQMEEGRLLTASIFYAGKMLFLYYEAVGEKKELMEPVESGCTSEWEKPGDYESGETLQTDCLMPEDFLYPLKQYMEDWPGQSGMRKWVYMYHIYYHAEPGTVSEWMEGRPRERKRGRIAFLRPEKLFSYTYYHKGLVDEGLIKGDKYMSIALHENILFSYFEEPRSAVNLKNSDAPSKVIEDWLKTGDRSHFIHMTEGGGENFMLLPALFTL